MSTTTDVRLKARYRSEIQGALKTQFGYKNPMQIPTLVKMMRAEMFASHVAPERMRNQYGYRFSTTS